MSAMLLVPGRSLGALTSANSAAQLAEFVRGGRCVLARASVGATLRAVRADREWVGRIDSLPGAHVTYVGAASDAGSRSAGTLSVSALDAYLNAQATVDGGLFIRLSRQTAVRDTAALALASIIDRGEVVAKADSATLAASADLLLVMAPGLTAIRVASGDRATFRGLVSAVPEAPRRAVVEVATEDELLRSYQEYCARITSLGDALLAAGEALERTVPGATFGRVEAAVARDRIARIATASLSVAFLGQFSSGKSSLINALLGVPLLASSDLPTTATVHRIRHGFQPRNSVRFKTREELANDVLDMVRAAEGEAWGPGVRRGEVGGGDLLRAALDLLMRAVDDADQSDRMTAQMVMLAESCTPLLAAEARFRADFGKVREFSRAALQSELLGERATVAVAEVVIDSDVPLLARGLELVDLPGTNSVLNRHTQLALGVIKEADVVVYVHSAQQPFNRVDADALRTLFTERRQQRGVDSVLQLVNKIDTCGRSGDVVDDIFRKTQEIEPSRPPPLPVAGLLGLCARMHLLGGGPDDLHNEDQAYYRRERRGGLGHAELFELSGVADVEAAINHCVERHRLPVMRQQVRRAGAEFADESFGACEDQRTIWESEANNRREKIAALSAAAQRYKAREVQLTVEILARTRSSGDRATEALRQSLSRRRAILTEDYSSHFANLQQLWGSGRALNFLNEEVLESFRLLFQEHLDEHAAAAIMALHADFDLLLADVRAFIRSMDEENEAIIYGHSRGPRRQRVVAVPGAIDPAVHLPADALTPRALGDRVLLSIDFGGRFGQRLLVETLSRAADELTGEVARRIQGVVEAHAREVERDACAELQRCVSRAVERAAGLEAQLADFGRSAEQWRADLNAFQLSAGRTVGALLE